MRAEEKEGMKLTADVVHPDEHYEGEGGRCRVRIFEQAGKTPVAVCSPLAGPYDTDIEAMAEYLAAEVVFVFFLPSVLWIEHYPATTKGPERFCRARFADTEPQETQREGALLLRLPLIGREELSRGEVEVLIGGVLDA
jgi:hypothetical protein